VRQAYEAGKYAFVSDYARLDVVHRYGGVYFDTDVLLLRNIDELLKYKAFFGFESENLVATGLGFGSIPGNHILKGLMEIYCKIVFTYKNGDYNDTACPYYHTAYFRQNEIQVNNSTQLTDDILFLASDFLCPKNQRTELYELTITTYSSHEFNISWFDENRRDGIFELRKALNSINSRLLADWQREYARG
jgi:hypothetical protein